MKLTYDPRFNIAYLRLREPCGEVRTLQVHESINVDIAPDGTLYGVEFLNANEQLVSSDHGAFVFEDEARGVLQEFALASSVAVGTAHVPAPAP